jgi:hypothetical protein
MASSAALATFVAHLMMGFKRRSGRIAQDGFSRKPCAHPNQSQSQPSCEKLVVFAKRSPQTNKTKPQSELMTALDQPSLIMSNGACPPALSGLPVSASTTALSAASALSRHEGFEGTLARFAAQAEVRVVRFEGQPPPSPPRLRPHRNSSAKMCSTGRWQGLELRSPWPCRRRFLR